MNAYSSSNEPADPWEISVKTVGGEHLVSDNSGAKDFTVRVSPEDDVSCLQEQIESITGWTASQQRLIYRGRLICGKKDTSEKIKDISGLSDGQTIHLVKRKDLDGEGESASEPRTIGSPNNENTTADQEPGSSSPSLLAALLGMGASDEGQTEEASTRRWRAARYGGRRRVPFRLTAEDIVTRDPGSMEPVRQGLMTLHTLLPNARGFEGNRERASPHGASRRFYIGQWIDCRDTVNQWCEATVVDVVEPNEILPESPESPPSSGHPQGSFTSPAGVEPAVGASDYEGRRLLLLEPCQEGDPDDEGGRFRGFRRRDNNEGVQLLLLHYNGWSHRWDEWIRSDSERIRAFRVRTRHPDTSNFASPTPQTPFNEAPGTYIQNEDERQDRDALLPELSRVLNSVNELVLSAAENSSSAIESTELSVTDREHLPWEVPLQEEEDGDSSSASRVPLNRRDLRSLVPLLDRLGRVLIDAAPHVAEIASRTGDTNQSEESQGTSSEEHSSSLGGLLSLLGRDRRRQSNASSNEATPGDTAVASVEGSAQPSTTPEATDFDDPDYSDYATGVVNTTRGEVRGGPRSRVGQTDDIASLFGAYLAAASLGGMDSQSNGDNGNEGLGRLIRASTGGGIDIHIHAIVTSPGGGQEGNIGIPIAQPVAPTPTTGLFSFDPHSSITSRTRNIPVPVETDDDNGIFSALYSENPDPFDPAGNRESSTANTHNSAVPPPQLRSSRIGSTSSIRRPLTTNRSLRSRRTRQNSSRRAGVFDRIFRRSNNDGS